MEDGAQVEVSKVYVVESANIMLLRYPQLQTDDATSKFLCLQLPCSLQLRVGERGTGENIRNILLDTSLWPQDASLVWDQFRFKLRVAESDEAPANLRAERLLDLARENAVDAVLHHRCVAHRIHSAATSSMELSSFSWLFSGVTHTLRSFWDRRHLKRFLKCLRSHIEKNFVFKRLLPNEELQLPRSAVYYKNLIFDLYAPSPDEPRRRALATYVKDTLLTGDWRMPVFEHHCRGHDCCHGADDSKAKVVSCVVKMAKSLRATMLEKGNWSGWPCHLRLFGLLGGLHQSLQAVLKDTFGAPDAAAQQLDNEAGDGGELEGEAAEMEQVRREKARSFRAAQTFADSEWFASLLVFSASLRPQNRLMARTLFSDSAEAEMSELKKQLSDGARSFNVVQLHGGEHTLQMLRNTLINVESMDLWDSLPSTELLRTQILQGSMRAAAFVWRTVVLRATGFPARIFQLLQDPSQASASAMLDTRRCQFSHVILTAFATPEELISETCLNLLACVASALRTTTYATERAHSRNSRLQKLRVQTKPIDLHTLAISHSGRAGPRWLLENARANLVSKRGKGRGRPKKKRQAEAPLDGERARVRVKRTGGGGPWRAFVHTRCQGQQLTRERLLALKTEYAQLTLREQAFFNELGQQGSLEVMLCSCLHSVKTHGQGSCCNSAQKSAPNITSHLNHDSLSETLVFHKRKSSVQRVSSALVLPSRLLSPQGLQRHTSLVFLICDSESFRCFAKCCAILGRGVESSISI